MYDRGIKNLKQLLEKCLKTTVLDYTLSDLTKPGENYGSILQSLEVAVVDGNDRCKVLHLVTKSAMTNPYLVDLFQPSRTFVKEARFYSSVIPAIERFEVESNVEPRDRLDLFVKCFGSRISLDSDTEIADADAVVILENTKKLSYINENRRVGFDSQSTFHILSSLAQFHALCIALRRNKPEAFKEHIVPHLPTINLYAVDEERQMNKMVLRDLQFVDGLDDEYRARVLTQVADGDKFDRDTIVEEDTPYTTIVHHDLWINNIMLLKDDSGKTAKVRVYDFQLYYYQSFVSDLIFFLLSSVRSEDLKRNFRIFINHYHEHFVKTLKRVNCPLTDYTIDKFWAEIRAKAKNELFHSMYITTLVQKEEVDARPIEEITEETFSPQKRSSNAMLMRWKLILDLYREHSLF